MACEFHSEAKRELFDVVAYYDGIDLALGNRFIQEIEQFPQAWAPLSANSRRCRLTSFPYGVVYQIVP